MKNVTVFLGSRIANKEIYLESVIELAKYIAESDHTLIYGGAQVGTMGILADTALEHHGKVIGIMPSVLADKEIMHQGITEKIIVKDMHERKMTLQTMGDIFIAMPGGCGTMEEIFEVITWNQIGVHQKPYCFVNIDNFYSGIRDYLVNANKLGFIKDSDLKKIYFFDTVEALIESKLI